MSASGFRLGRALVETLIWVKFYTFVLRLGKRSQPPAHSALCCDARRASALSR